MYAQIYLFISGDTSVHGVIIATVTYSHECYVNKCIQAKKAIFCEKPIASNLKDTSKLFNLLILYFNNISRPQDLEQPYVTCYSR